MQRLSSWLAVVAALALGTLVATLSSRTVVEAPAASNATSTRITVVPTVEVPRLSLPTLAPAFSGATTTKTASSSRSLPAPAPKKSPPAPTAAPSTQATTTRVSEPVVAQPPTGALDASATSLRDALVNIVCYAPAAAPYHSISGSGIMISPSGYILTNAHVAQYFLLEDQGVDCAIRTGSPAVDTYTAKLAFISPAWIYANAGLLTTASPSGTGERDFAILAVESRSASAPRGALPYVPLAHAAPAKGSSVVIGSYGAQFLSPVSVENSLFPTLVYGSVKDVYTFGTNTIDVLDLGGSAAAQEGSSGGGVGDREGTLVGTITTSTVTGDTSTRSLDAITASYVRADYATETGTSLDSLLSLATSTAVANFANERATLEAKLLSAIAH